MSLLQASEKDANILADIHAQCFPHYWDVDAFNNFFSVPNTLALLASADNGETAGMMVWRNQQEQSDIITLAVRPPFRRQGFAASMLEYAFTQMQQAGVRDIFLDVEYGNEAAIRLYEMRGFSYIRRRRLYYRQVDGSYTDALVMRKTLEII